MFWIVGDGFGRLREPQPYGLSSSPLIKYTSSQRADVRYAPTSAISALIGQTCNRTFVVEVG